MSKMGLGTSHIAASVWQRRNLWRKAVETQDSHKNSQNSVHFLCRKCSRHFSCLPARLCLGCVWVVCRCCVSVLLCTEWMVTENRLFITSLLSHSEVRPGLTYIEQFSLLLLVEDHILSVRWCRNCCALTNTHTSWPNNDHTVFTSQNHKLYWYLILCLIKWILI